MRHGLSSFVISVALYAAIILVFGPSLAVSSNYFVALPVIVAALIGGVWAGLAAGALGLPANLAIFALIGHPEFSPASKPIAEGFGLIVGFALGYLADYYDELEGEIRKRAQTEESLRKALIEKELLFQELNHRVRNNLNVIKSLAQLQRNRSSDPAFIAAADELVGRILAISLVHDQLYESDSPLVDPRVYLAALAANVASSFSARSDSVSVKVEVGERVMRSEIAMPLGLVVNEALTNAMKHARSPLSGEPAGPSVSLELAIDEGQYLLTVRDEGPGAARPNGDGLGVKIVIALARQLGGEATLRVLANPDGSNSGAILEMRWPAD